MRNLKKSKKLSKISPFNDFFFISCYYHQFMTGIKHLGGKIDGIIARYFPAYEFKENENILGIKEFKAECGDELEKVTGVHVIRKRNSLHLIYELLRAIDRGQPCLVAVDCFELSYREDTYRKRHALHFLLVYGYDLETYEFLVFEHMFANSPRYIGCRITFREIEKAFYKLDRFWKGYKLQKLKKSERQILEGLGFPECCFIWRKDIEKSMEACHKMLSFFKRCMSEESSCIQYINYFIEYFGLVRSKKLTQKYQFRYLGCIEQSEVVDRILNNYIFIYGIMMRIKVIGNYNPKDIEKLLKKCEEVELLEKKVHYFYMRGEK